MSSAPPAMAAQSLLRNGFQVRYSTLVVLLVPSSFCSTWSTETRFSP
jgi:hypothetical protein